MFRGYLSQNVLQLNYPSTANGKGFESPLFLSNREDPYGHKSGDEQRLRCKFSEAETHIKQKKTGHIGIHIRTIWISVLEGLLYMLITTAAGGRFFTC